MTRTRPNPAILLLAATAAALAWANSPLGHVYEDVWRGWPHTLVNDGLMSLFFLVVGVEIKREVVEGGLRDRRHAMLPVIAAVGGMIVPALLYFSIARDRGWGIPMATDIAFALGLLTALGRRVPAALKLFLLTLAVVDDIGAVAVMAVFYGQGLDHPAIAGVAVGLLVPVRHTARVEHALTPWTSLIVLPVFALANAGVRLEWAGSRITVGVVVGLVAGKAIGVTGAAWAAVRLGLARLPDGVTWRHMAGVGLVAGVGFTVSLFVAGLAFEDPSAVAEAKLGILAGSLAASLGGLAWLTRS